VIRSLRKPEPYKGKGIKYENENIRARKAEEVAPCSNRTNCSSAVRGAFA